jgi:hypothetical protein
MADYSKAFAVSKSRSHYDITYSQDEPSRTDTVPSVLIIDSKYRDSGYDQSNYNVTLLSPYQDVVSVELVYCDIPTGNYNVIRGINDRINFDTDTSSNITAVVPAGLYTLDPITGNNASSIRYAVFDALNGAANRNYFYIPTVTARGTLQFTAVNNFAFNFDGGLTPMPQNGNTEARRRNYAPMSIGELLGFRPATYTSVVNSIVSSYPPLLEMDRFITMHIDGMPRCDSTNGAAQDCFCILPMDSKNSNFDLLKDGNNIDNEEYIYYCKQPRKLHKLQIAFKDMRGNPYNFQGQEHVLIFKIYTKTHKKKY